MLCATQQLLITQPAAAAGVLIRNGEGSGLERFGKTVSICFLKQTHRASIPLQTARIEN